MILMPNLTLFLIIAMFFFGCTAIFQPLLQEQVANSGQQREGSAIIMGFYNAIKSLGMIFGALVAGLIYNFLPELPFWMAGFFFMLAALFSFIYSRMHRAEY